MILVVLGAPGAGKGTQARNLSKRLNITHISTGDMLRAHMAEQTSVGASIETMMKTGRLVPDELIIGIVKDRVKEGDCAKGFILDGFPRTLIQTRALDAVLDEIGASIHKVISVDVSDGVIVDRMSGRLICPACGATFHTLYHPPVKDGACDNCGSDLTQREDDKAKTVLERLALYHEITEPIISYYADKNILATVNGVGAMDEITDRIYGKIIEE